MEVSTSGSSGGGVDKVLVASGVASAVLCGSLYGSILMGRKDLRREKADQWRNRSMERSMET